MGDADFEGPWFDDWDPFWSPPHRRRPNPRPSDIDAAVASAPERPRPTVLPDDLADLLVRVARDTVDLDMNGGDYGYDGWEPGPSVDNWHEVVEAIAFRMRQEGWRPPKRKHARRSAERTEPLEDGSALRFRG